MPNAERITRPIIVTEDDMPKPIEPAKLHNQLAAYIVEWLTTRNAGEIAEALGNQRVVDRELLLGELALILANAGKPPNWV